jgi:bisphosphoglycerate-dependent phosphoglycerate mutase
MEARITIAMIISAVLFCFGGSEAQQVIFLVRHAETVAPRGTDLRPLSEAGQRRAVLLAKLLKDAGINAIYTSDLERTVKTAEPLAESLRIEPKPLSQLSVSFNPTILKILLIVSETSIARMSYWLLVIPILFRRYSRGWDIQRKSKFRKRSSTTCLC